MARIPHLPKKEFPHSMLIWVNQNDGKADNKDKLASKPLRINNVKFEERKTFNSEQILLSNGIIFIDTKHSSGYNDLYKDFTINSRIEINNNTFTIASSDYVNIMGELHHIEIVLK